MIKTNKVLYAATIEEFSKLARSENDFAEKLKEHSMACGFRPGDAEVDSWKGNSTAFNVLFKEANLPKDAVVAFEYRAPVGGRVDCMLFGKGKDGINNVVLFELKGWKDAKLCFNNTLIKDQVETFTGGRLQDVEHPSIQAERYHMHFTNYIELLNSNDYRLTSLAYCYNYVKSDKNNALYHKNFEEVMKNYPLFTKEDRNKLAVLLSDLLCMGNGESVFDAVVSCQERPTEKLINAAADLVVDKDKFYLLGDQNVAFKKFESILEKSLEEDNKSVIIIKGGPGTGKTVLALKMLSHVAIIGNTPVFTTRSTALRDELRRALKKLRVKDLILIPPKP